MHECEHLISDNYFGLVNIDHTGCRGIMVCAEREKL